MSELGLSIQIAVPLSLSLYCWRFTIIFSWQLTKQFKATDSDLSHVRLEIGTGMFDNSDNTSTFPRWPTPRTMARFKTCDFQFPA